MQKRRLTAFLTVGCLLGSTASLHAAGKILWQQLVRGEGPTEVEAITNLIKETDEKSEQFLATCEKVGGMSTWSSEIETSRSVKVSSKENALVYAFQDFICAERPRVETAEARARPINVTPSSLTKN